jgi:hypothetical protein
MTQQLQPILSGFLWGLGSSLVLIVAALVAARDTPLTTPAPQMIDVDHTGRP